MTLRIPFHTVRLLKTAMAGSCRGLETNHRALATSFRERSRTWLQFAKRVARLAGGLQGLGVRPSDRVAILAHNSDRFTEYFFAVARAGAVFVPINTRLAIPEIAYWIEDSASQILPIDDAFLPLLADLKRHIPCVRHVVYIGEAPPPSGLVSYEGIIGQHARQVN